MLFRRINFRYVCTCGLFVMPRLLYNDLSLFIDENALLSLLFSTPLEE